MFDGTPPLAGGDTAVFQSAAVVGCIQLIHSQQKALARWGQGLGNLTLKSLFRKFDKRKIMRTALQVDITFDQVLALVRQLPPKEKIKLTKELEKEGIETKLSGLLKTFRTKELSLDTINAEVEIVRQQIYESKKH